MFVLSSLLLQYDSTYVLVLVCVTKLVTDGSLTAYLELVPPHSDGG